VLPGVAQRLSRKAQLWITIGLLILIGALLIYGWWQRQPQTLAATPAGLSWQRTIEVESQSPVTVSSTQREVARTEQYECILRAGEREFPVALTAEELGACTPETSWQVRIDGDGAVLEAAPNGAGK
jgi:hypothetical protein